MKSKQAINDSGKEGPQLKGKGTDPLNWGNVDIGRTELNVEVQKKEFERIESQNKKRHAN
jgi:hypothetical protein